MTSPATMDLAARVEEFAARRADRLRRADDELRVLVREALEAKLAGVPWWFVDLVDAAGVLWLEIYEESGLRAPDDDLDEFVARIEDHILKTSDVPESGLAAQVDRVTNWVSVFTINDAVDTSAALGVVKRWVTMRDEDVRDTHRPLEGRTAPLGGTFDVGGYPLHFPGEPVGPPEIWINCVLADTQVTWAGQDVLAATRRQHVGTFVELRTRDGHHLTITPNHPVLTPTGYVPAGDLRPGDHVLATLEPVAPDVPDGPPSIEQVYGAARQNGQHRRVGPGGVDFHGDRPDDEVDVVWPDGDLSGRLGSEPGEGDLVGSDRGEPGGVAGGLADRPGGDGGEVLLLAGADGGVGAPGDVGAGGQFAALGGGEAAHAEPVGLAAAAGGEAEFAQPQADDRPTDAETARHLQDAHALGMQPSELVEVNISTGTHDVYNLHTSDNHYNANGIAVHNCRCMIFPVPEAEMATLTAATTSASAPEGEIVDLEAPDGEEPPEWDDSMDVEVPWHGILAIEGIPTGDRRRFARGALRFDEFPLPLTFQRAEADRHDGAVIVGNITGAWVDEHGLVKAEGWLHSSPEADEVIDLIANGMLRGVSLSLDDAVASRTNRDGAAIDFSTGDVDDADVYTQIDDARVRSATALAIAAFAEGFLALGPWEEAEGEESGSLAAAGCAPCAAAELDQYYATLTDFAISEDAWDGSASRFSDEQWRRATVVDRGASHESVKERFAVPIREPDGDLNRAAVHNAAARIDQVQAPAKAVSAGRKRLVAAYRLLEEDPPESLTAAAFGITSNPSTHDGPGWITHPRATQRLRTYWTRGPGAAKIGWGAPHDFYRCRRQLAKYVQNPSHLSGTCANLHKVALGFWPGQHHGVHASAAPETLGNLEVLVAAAPASTLPAKWFADPQVNGPTALRIEYDEVAERYRVYGHAALWDTCHTGYGLSIGNGSACTEVPRSTTNYAWYRLGAVMTDEGEVPVGHITLGTGHAGEYGGPVAAASHYDNTGTAVADVAAGEDEFGIWIAGALRASCTDSQREELRAATLSGDWRWVGNNLEMVATLAVNVPGFPVPRLQVAASGGRQTALLAAGVVDPTRPVDVVEPVTVRSVAAEVVKMHRRSAHARLARDRLAVVGDHVRAERAAAARAKFAALTAVNTH